MAFDEQKRFERLYHDQEILLDQGHVVWGHVFQANPSLLRRGRGDAAAAILYSADPRVDTDPDLLELAARALAEIHIGQHREEDVRELARALSDDETIQWKIPIPARLTQGVACFYAATMISRRHLPQKCLDGSLLPLLICPERTDVTMVLPGEYWSPRCRGVFQQSPELMHVELEERPDPGSTKSIWRPSILGGLWTGLVFLFAVVQLYLVSGDLWVFVRYLLPPVFAYIFSLISESRWTRFLCGLFLSAISLGVAIGPCMRVLPEMKPPHEGLPAKEGRILAWYLFQYVVFVLNVLPLYLFTVNLRNHKRGWPTDFSRFTCRLGLVAAIFIGPLGIAVSVSYLGLWPVFG